MAERTGLLERFARKGVFSRLTQHEVAAVFASAKLQRVDQGAKLIHQGETSRDYILLIDGELEVRREWTAADGTQEVSVGVIRPGEGVGEMALLSALPRGATVAATSNSRLLRIDGELMDELLTWCSALADRLHDDAEERRRMNAVRQTPVFRQLPLATMQCAFDRMQPMDVAAGAVIVREGAPGDSYFLIESGRAEVVRGGDTVAELGPGAAFGEEALLLEAPRNATVRMIEDGRLWRLDKTDFGDSVRAAVVEELTPARAAEMVAAGAAQWIDCRMPEEYAALHIPGARLLPISQVRQQAASLDPKTTYVVYCRNGIRSACATFLLREKGLKAFSLAGGLSAWPYQVATP